MDAFYLWITAYLINKGIVFLKRDFFRDQGFKRLFFLDTDMSPETENLLAHLFLESVGKCQGNDHHRHTDHGGHNGKADDKPGKGTLLIECNAVCYKRCNLQD